MHPSASSNTEHDFVGGLSNLPCASWVVVASERRTHSHAYPVVLNINIYLERNHSRKKKPGLQPTHWELLISHPPLHLAEAMCLRSLRLCLTATKAAAPPLVAPVCPSSKKPPQPLRRPLRLSPGRVWQTGGI